MSAYLGPVFWLVVYVAFLAVVAPLMGFNRLDDDEDEHIEDYGIGSGTLPVIANEETTSA